MNKISLILCRVGQLAVNLDIYTLASRTTPPTTCHLLPQHKREHRTAKDGMHESNTKN